MHFLNCVHESSDTDFGSQAVGTLQFEGSLPDAFELTSLVVHTDALEDVSDLVRTGLPLLCLVA